MNVFREYTLHWLGILFAGLSAASCESPVATGAAPAFDMEAYFSQEAQRMTGHHAVLVKTARLNNRTETRMVDVPDWTGEFRVFSDCALDRTSWQQSYVCDTVQLAAGLRSIRYAAREYSARIAAIQIVENGSVPVSITVEKRTANVFYRTSTRLRYVPDSGFVIRHDRKALLRDPDSLEIRGAFRFSAPVHAGQADG